MTNVNDLLRRTLTEGEFWAHTNICFWKPEATAEVFKEAHDYLDRLEERAKYDVSKEYNEPPRLIVELCQDHPYQGFELVTRKIIQPNPAEFSLLCRGCGKDDRPLRVTPEDMVQRQIGRSIDGAVPRQLVHDRIDSEAVRLTRLEGVVGEVIHALHDYIEFGTSSKERLQRLLNTLKEAE